MTDMNKKIKVLSLKEPFASLIKENIKKIETRSWKTNYRGKLYIHASKKKLSRKEEIEEKEQINLLKDRNFNYGCIIAECNLTDCKFMDRELIKEIKKNKKELICGSYEVGRYAWMLEDIKVLEKPIEAKGQLGIWNYKNK